MIPELSKFLSLKRFKVYSGIIEDLLMMHWIISATYIDENERTINAAVITASSSSQIWKLNHDK